MIEPIKFEAVIKTLKKLPHICAYQSNLKMMKIYCHWSEFFKILFYLKILNTFTKFIYKQQFAYYKMYSLLNLVFTFFVMIGLFIVDFLTEESTFKVYFNVELIKNYIKNIFF